MPAAHRPGVKKLLAAEAWASEQARALVANQ
jgi:hypothetical protein